MAISTEDFLKKVRLQSKIPERQIADDNLMSIIDGVVLTKIVPEIVTTNGNFFKFSPTPKTITASDYTYRFPAGAIGGGLLDVIRKQDVASQQYWNIGQITEGDKYKVLTKYGTDYYFILTAGGLTIFPNPQGTFIMEIHYLLRPGKLIKSSSSVKVLSVNALANTFVMGGSAPLGWGTSPKLDVMKPDGLNERVVVEAQAAISGTTVSVSDASAISIGDTVALTGFAPYLQVPDDYIDYVVDRVSIKLAQLTGDETLLQMAKLSAAESKPNVLNVINPRVREEVAGVTPDW
jgi:hypothetical protein